MKFATYWDRESWAVDTGTVNVMESLTDQSFLRDSDINYTILKLGGVPRTPVRLLYRGNVEARYDLENYDTDDWTFEDWQNQKAVLERRFLHLTPEAKRYFGSPAAFFEYCSNPKNYELIDGMMKEKPKEEFPTYTQPPQGGNQSVTPPVTGTE